MTGGYFPPAPPGNAVTADEVFDGARRDAAASDLTVSGPRARSQPGRCGDPYRRRFVSRKEDPVADKDEQLAGFRDAVQRKMDEADAASRAGRDVTSRPDARDEGGGDQSSLTDTGRSQDALSVRDKNAQKGKKTADKWNQ